MAPVRQPVSTRDGLGPSVPALTLGPASKRRARSATIIDSCCRLRHRAARYGVPELIDVVITVAGYRMVSIALNSLGTQLEPGRPRFPDVPR